MTDDLTQAARDAEPDWRALFEAANGALICIGSMPGDWQDYAQRTADDLNALAAAPAKETKP